MGPWRAWLATLAALLWLLGGWTTARAQTLDPAGKTLPALSQYKLDRWQTEQGLPMNTVQALLQGRDGRLWVGTGGGLATFDGSRFSGPGAAAAVPELDARPIFGFFQAADGAVWIGHIRGAARFDQGRYEAAIGADITEGRRIWSFAQAADGAIWAATENGLVRWQAGQVRRYQEAEGLPTRRVRSLAFDRDGTLWIGTTGGGLVAMRDGRFTVFDAQRGFPHPEVRQVLADPAGGVWAATAGGGLVQVVQDRLRTYTVADGLPTDHLTALAFDATGALWIGTWGSGLSRLADGRFTTIGSAGGLDGDHVWALHADREGSLWVGTWHGGLNRLSRRSFVVFGKPEGLPSDNVRAVLHARDGATWVSTAGGGVSRIEGGRITAFGRRQGLATDEASTLYEDSDGAIWIGTYTEGVSRLRGERVENFGVAQGLPHADVRVLLRDRRGTLWVGTRGGLARFDGRRFEPVREAGAPTEGISALAEDAQGTLWIGTAGNGLVRWRDGRFDVLTRADGLPSNWIMALHLDRDGALWIGTSGEGLARLRDGQIRRIGTADGLWDGLVQVILEDAEGHFWMTCNRGFFRAARAELDAFADGRAPRVSSAGYGPADALRASTFAGGVQSAGAADPRGHLWLPSVRGLVIVDPRRLPDHSQPPGVSVEAVAIDTAAVPAADGVVLPPGAVSLAIRYRADTLLHAERVRFRYRLEGLHDGWVDAGPAREASFAGLPHGQYRFHVAATLDGRHWREAGAPLAVTVQPRLHQTRAFQLLVALSLLGASVAAVRWRTQQMRRRQAELVRQVAEQTEALRQANEHLSRLSFADALTGLPNRRRLDEVLDSEWRRALRLRQPLAVVLVDIDAFKAYNDSLGHPEGDRCLARVADIIRRTTHRAGDFAARYGGEEFLILLPGADAAAAAVFAEHLRAACEAAAIPHPASPLAPVVTLSAGVASRVPTVDATPMSLVAAADAALYRAKQDGRNRVR